MTGVRRARPDDVPELAESLALAFDDDPIFVRLLANDRVARLRRFFEATLHVVHLPLGEAWITEDRKAAALFAPPGRWRVSLWQEARLLLPMLPVFGRSAFLGQRMHAETERVHPTHPHFYLSVLGVHPSMQGKGLGARVLRPVLDRCDAESIDAYLESSNEKNHTFYRRQGFTPTRELPLPGDVKVWTMQRAPAVAAS